MPQKIWDIGAAAASKSRLDAPSPTPIASPGPSPDLSAPPTTKRRWSRVVAAYTVGPLALPFWCSGLSRMVWTILGYGSVLGALAIALCWPRVTRWLDATPGGNVWFLAIVPTLALVLAMSWARAVRVATRRPARATPVPSAWQHDRWVVAALGFLVPGLGLLIAGHPRRAALAFGVIGPLAAGTLVLANASSLWSRSRSEIPAGLSGVPLEVGLLVAGALVGCALLVWILQALDGARLASSSVGTHLPRVLSAALLATLALFVFTARPTVFAENMYRCAIDFQRDGYRLIPLGLCEAAIRLDPTRAAYLATGAELDHELGRVDAAAAKRLTIAVRAQEYGALVPEGPTLQTDAASSRGQSLWSRVSVLVR